MGEQKRSFKEMGAQSGPYEELAEIRRQFTELKRVCRRLCVHTANLTYQIRSKDQEIDALYDKLYWIAEMPKKKKDRNKMHRAIQAVENRPQNRQNGAFQYTGLLDVFDTDMLAMEGISGPREKHRVRRVPSNRGESRHNDSWAAVWNGDYDEYE